MPTTLSTQITALATQIGTDVKTIVANVGDISTLTTNQKASLVVALNELKAAIGEVQGLIDDEQTTEDSTWSSVKIHSQITAAIDALVSGAPGTLDTLKELGDAITTNQSAIEALQSIANGHVKFNAAQTLTGEQQTQARSNIGAAAASDVTTLQSTVSTMQSTVETTEATANANKTAIGTLTSLTTTAKENLVVAINEVKASTDNVVTVATDAQSKANAAQSSVTTLTTNVGDTQRDFVADYEAARGEI